ncbi:MAG: flagellar biosynthesis anti-sigma factor FlgM [Campylobacterota bacterium]|nr:flagellar biosynthesis anti-sigma factor FlgM [Campylobacterota bacterium]
MISQVNAGTIRNAYQNSETRQKDEKKDVATVSEQGDMSKVDQIKASIENGEYQLNLQALANKIADELL